MKKLSNLCTQALADASAAVQAKDGSHDAARLEAEIRQTIANNRAKLSGNLNSSPRGLGGTGLGAGSGGAAAAGGAGAVGPRGRPNLPAVLTVKVSLEVRGCGEKYGRGCGGVAGGGPTCRR